MSNAEERLANDPTSVLWGEHRSRYRFAARLATEGQHVLDVACGAGFGLEMLKEAGACPLGVDYDAYARICRRCGLSARMSASVQPYAAASV